MAKKKSTSTKSKAKETSDSKKEEETKKEEPKAPEGETRKESEKPTPPKQEEPKEVKEVKEEKAKTPQNPFKLISDGDQVVRAMEIRGAGVMVQVKEGNAIGMQWMPQVHLEETEEEGIFEIKMGY